MVTLSDWQEGNPPCVGIYQVSSLHFKYWNGSFWGIASGKKLCKKVVRANKNIKSASQDQQWRGVIDESSGATLL